MRQNKIFLSLFLCVLSLNAAFIHRKIMSTYAERHSWRVRKESIPFQNFHMTTKFSGGKLHLSRNALVSFYPEKKLAINRVQFHAKFSHRSFFYMYVNKETSHSAAFRTSALSSMPNAWLIFKGNRLSRKIKIKKFPVLQVTRAPHTLLFTFSSSRILRVFADDRKIFQKKIPQKEVSSVSFLAGDNEVMVDDVNIQGRDAAGVKFTFPDDFSFQGSTADFLFEVFVLLAAFSIMAWFMVRYLCYACGLSFEEILKSSRRKLQPVFFLLVPGLFLFFPFPLHIALLVSALIITGHRFLIASVEHSRRFAFEPHLFTETPFRHDVKKIVFYFIVCIIIAACFQFSMLKMERRYGFSSRALKDISAAFSLKLFSAHEVHTKPLTMFSFQGSVFIPEGGVVSVDFLKKTVPVSTDETFRTGLGFGDFYTLVLSCDADFPTQLFFVSDINIKPVTRRPPDTASTACGKWNAFYVRAEDVFLEIFLNGRLLVRTLRQSDTFVKTNHISFLSMKGNARIKNFHILPPAASSWFMDNARSVSEVLFYLSHIFVDILCFLFCVAVFSKGLSLYLKKNYRIVFRKILWNACLLGLAVIFALPMRKSGHAYGFYIIFLSISAVFFSCFIGLYEHSRMKKNSLTVLFVVFFLDVSSIIYAPYISQAKTPWYASARSSVFYWFLDPQVRVHNNFFALYRLRGRRVHAEKGNKTRIVTLGGSQTWGEGIPILSRNVFPFQIEDKSNALPQSNPTYEVINGASGGANSFTQLVFFKGVLLPFKPDLLILNFSHNDAMFDRGSLKEYARLEKQGGHVPFYDEPLTLSLVHSFLRRVTQSIWGVFVRRFVLSTKGSEEAQVKNLRANLRVFCALAAENNFKLVFLLEPYYILYLKYQDPQIKKMYKTIREEGKECGVPALDMFSVFYKHRDEDLFLDGLHLSEGGHELMADEIIKFITLSF